MHLQHKTLPVAISISTQPSYFISSIQYGYSIIFGMCVVAGFCLSCPLFRALAFVSLLHLLDRIVAEMSFASARARRTPCLRSTILYLFMCGEFSLPPKPYVNDINESKVNDTGAQCADFDTQQRQTTNTPNPFPAESVLWFRTYHCNTEDVRCLRKQVIILFGMCEHTTIRIEECVQCEVSMYYMYYKIASLNGSKNTQLDIFRMS